jgi:hypothetical protein
MSTDSKYKEVQCINCTFTSRSHQIMPRSGVQAGVIK